MDDHEYQPKKGERVLLCKHVDSASGLHWWRMHKINFMRPDGTRGEAEWAAACDGCFVASEGNPLKIRFADDGVWDGSPMQLRPKS